MHTAGEHGSPLQNNGKFVPFIKFDLTYNLYRYLRADNIRPYEIVQIITILLIFTNLERRHTV